MFFLHVFGPSSGSVPFVYSLCTFGQLAVFCDQYMFLYSSKKKKKKNIYIYIYIFIGGLSTNKIIILIQGLGECERVGEDSGSELVM